MLHLYALVDRPHIAIPEIAGVDGRPPVFIAKDGVALVVGGHGDKNDATLSAIERHEAVVEALMADHAVLPARFGSLVPGRVQALDLLSGRHREITTCLRQVAGCVEIGLHLAWRGPGSGIADGKRSGETERPFLHASFDAQIGRVQTQLARYARQSRRIAVGAHEGIADLAFLVAADWLPTLLAKARALRRECRDAVMVCTGPWPPYSFVDLDLSNLRQETGDAA